MPINTKGGKGHKKCKNKAPMVEYKVLLKDSDYQDYGVVTKALGDLRFNVLCSNDKQVQGHIRGKMNRRQWVRVGDLVLFSWRETDSNKVDIIHKYSDEQAKQVRKIEGIAFSCDFEKQNNTQGIVFDVGDESEDEEPNDKQATIAKMLRMDSDSDSDASNNDEESDKEDNDSVTESDDNDEKNDGVTESDDNDVDENETESDDNQIISYQKENTKRNGKSHRYNGKRATDVLGQGDINIDDI